MWFLFLHSTDRRKKKLCRYFFFFPHLVFWNTHNFFFITDFLFETISFENGVYAGSVVATVCVRLCIGVRARFRSMWTVNTYADSLHANHRSHQTNAMSNRHASFSSCAMLVRCISLSVSFPLSLFPLRFSRSVDLALLLVGCLSLSVAWLHHSNLILLLEATTTTLTNKVLTQTKPNQNIDRVKASTTRAHNTIKWPVFHPSYYKMSIGARYSRYDFFFFGLTRMCVSVCVFLSIIPLFQCCHNDLINLFDGSQVKQASRQRYSLTMKPQNVSFSHFVPKFRHLILIAVCMQLVEIIKWHSILVGIFVLIFIFLYFGV